VKPFHFVILAAGILGTAMPAVAQISGTAPYEFINAVRVGDGNRATELLGSAGAGILDTRDGNGETALTIAVARSDEQFTGFLLGKGADPNRTGKGGDTPLIIAARIGFAQGMEWLLGVGAKVDATNKMGETALIAAVMQRQTQSVRRLLAAGADPDKADTSAGYTARDYAQRDPRARQILQMIEAKKPKK
jgi:ankyrin repeat protein